MKGWTFDLRFNKSRKFCACVLLLSVAMTSLFSGCTVIDNVTNRALQSPVFTETSNQVRRIVDQVTTPNDQYVSLDDAAVQLRQAMLERQPTIELYVYSENLLDTTAIMNLMTNACAETGAWNNGDYLYWNLSDGSGMEVRFKYESADQKHWHITVSGLTYKTTVEQEQEVVSALSSLRQELGLDDFLSDEQKVERIYTWITANVAYDHDSYNLNHDSDPNNNTALCYTPYSALVNRQAVCQGYAGLFYAMCRMVGVEARVVYGQADGGDGWGSHAWNIVKLSDGWYEFDPTWDAGHSSWTWRYYAKGTEDMSKNHTLDAVITSPDFIHAWNGNTEAID